MQHWGGGGVCCTGEGEVCSTSEGEGEQHWRGGGVSSTGEGEGCAALGEGDGKAYLVLAERCLLHPGVGNHVHQRDPQHLRPRGEGHACTWRCSAVARGLTGGRMNILLNRSTRSLDMRAVSSGHSRQKSSLRSGLPRRLPSNPRLRGRQQLIPLTCKQLHDHTFIVYDVLLVPKV